MKIVYPDYNNCITNLACSIAKDFDLEVSNKTIAKLDKKLLNNYKNVVVILYDGMGSNIIDKCLKKDSFLIKNKILDLTSTFPATTTAATTAMRTGLNPIEHGYLGWDMYFEDINEVITLFRNTYKDTNIPYKYNVTKEKLNNKTIVDRINNETDYKAYDVLPFGEGCYDNLSTMYERIINLTKLPGKKYIYAYVEDPDSTMHKYGVEKAYPFINDVNKQVESLSKMIDDTLLIITADHGHINSSRIVLKEYDDIFNMLERTTSLEPRACSFKIKSACLNEFKDLFNKYFSSDFNLLSKEEVINKNLFGFGIENKYFNSALGDYIAIAIGDKYFVYDEYGENYLSAHAGITYDEMLIPLITIDTKKDKEQEIIRKADSKDYNQIRPLVNELQLFNVKNRKDLYVKCEAMGRVDFTSLCNGLNNQIALVFEENNKIVGYIEGQVISIMGELLLNPIIYLEIKRLVVKKEYRRKKIATRLYQEILQYAYKLHADNIRVNIEYFNKEGIKFFESLDMQEFTISFDSKVEKKKRNI